MNYISFTMLDNKKVICFYNYNGEIIRINNKEADKLFSLLLEMKVPIEEKRINKDITLTFYNLDKYLNVREKLKKIRQNEIKKVNRINKFVKNTPIIASCALSVAVILTSCALKDVVKDVEEKKEEVDNSFSILEGKKELSVHIVDDNAKNVEENIVFPEEEQEVSVMSTPNYEYNFEEDNINNVIIPDVVFDFKFEDRSSSDKAKNTKELYYDLIKKYSDIYGLPTNLMVAMATQECGVHKKEVSSGGGFGLFQIQVNGGWSWEEKTISVYNFEKEEDEKIVVCEVSPGVTDVNMLADLEYNIKIGCAIFAYNLRDCNYDIIQAIQTYNSGTEVRIIKNSYGEDWINHRDTLLGDPKYLEHVLSFIDPSDNILEYKDDKNNVYYVQVNNLNNYAHTLS